MSTESILVREASGEHNADPWAVETAARGWLKDTDLLIHTETTDAAHAAIVKAGWSAHAMHRTSLPNGNPGEILIAWNPKVLRAHAKGENLRLSDRAFKVGNIQRDGVTAGRQLLEVIDGGWLIVVYGVHWPSGIFNFLVRMLASRETSRTLGGHIEAGIHNHPDRCRIVGGDTNESHFRRLVRRYYEKTLHLIDVWSKVTPKHGSHGSRLIDTLFLRGFHVEAAGVDPKTDASDHCSIWARVHRLATVELHP